MRDFKIDLLKCKLNDLLPDEYVLLYFLYFKNYIEIEKIFGKEYAIQLRNKLCETKYILSNNQILFKHTILSEHVKKLLDIKDDIINFWEWYNIYPHKVGTRILRAVSIDTKKAKKHERQYLSIVKTLDMHKDICKRTEDFVAMKRQSNSLEYLPQIERILNNREWENWIDLKPKTVRWNQTVI